MIPRLYVARKLWYCKLPGMRSGMGYTFFEAYLDWFTRNGMRMVDAKAVGV